MSYSEAVAEKRDSQNVYAKNISILPFEQARACSYGQVRRARNSLVRMIFKYSSSY